MAGGTGFTLARDPDTVRAPAAAVVLKQRVTGERLPVGYLEGSPDLVVEVSTTSRSIAGERVNEWLDAGAQQVWVLYPRTRSVRRHQPGKEVQFLQEDDVLTGDPLLPGFTCRVRDLFP